MYKNFNLTESEKEQILNMHKDKGYGKPLNEQTPNYVPNATYINKQQNKKPEGEPIPMPNAVPPADQAIANEILNNVKTQEALVKILPKIKNAKQFLNVSNGIKIASNNTTYDFFELASRYGGSSLANRLNGGSKAGVATKQITDYLTKIGVRSQSNENGEINFQGIAPTAVKKQTQWKPETGKFPLLLGQVGPNIQKVQLSLGLKGDKYFGAATEKAILSKVPEYKRQTGVTQEIYNKIVANTAVSKDLKTTYDMNTQAGKDAYLQQGLKSTSSVNPAAKYSQITPQQQANADALKNGQALPK
jgi:hypothetical protein